MTSSKRKKKSPWQVAAVIAEMMRRAKSSRARISDKSLRLLSGRVRLESSIRKSITDDLYDYGYLLVPLSSTGSTRGNAIIALSALHAAKPLRGKDVFSEDEIASIDKGDFDFDGLHDDLMGDEDDDDDLEPA